MVCVSVPQVNPTTLSYSSSSPYVLFLRSVPLPVLHLHPYLSGTKLLRISEFTFKPANLQTNAWSLQPNVFLCTSPPIHTYLCLAQEYRTGQYLFYPHYFYSLHKVTSTSESHDKKTGRCSPGRGCRDGPPLRFTKQVAAHRQTPAAWQSRSRIVHNRMFTREVDRSKFLSGIILPNKKGFKSITWPILSQLRYGEMHTDSNSRNQKLSSGFTVANPDMRARFHSAELVTSTVLLKLAW